MGPTGGYLIGFILTAFFAGMIKVKNDPVIIFIYLLFSFLNDRQPWLLRLQLRYLLELKQAFYRLLQQPLKHYQALKPLTLLDQEPTTMYRFLQQ